VRGLRQQTSIYVAGVSGRRPKVPTDATMLEERARDAMSAEAFAYVAGGAGTGATMRANRAAFDRWRIVPRMLRDVAGRDTSVELFGRTLPSPFLIAPIGVLEMAHREAERAVARAVRDLGLPMVYSN
jgi:lactate 2-monooxygenase